MYGVGHFYFVHRMLYLVCRNPATGKDVPKCDERSGRHDDHVHIIYVSYLDRSTGKKSKKSSRLPDGSSLYFGVGSYRQAFSTRDRLRGILAEHEWSVRHGRPCRADCAFCPADPGHFGAADFALTAHEFSEKILPLLASPHETNEGKFRSLRRITIDGYRYVFNKLQRTLGDDLHFPLSQAQVEDFVRRRLADGVSQRTVNTDLRGLKAVLNLAVKHCILPAGSTPRIVMCDVSDKAIEILTPEQVHEVTEAATRRGHLHQLAVFGLLYQGLRPGDLSPYRQESAQGIRWKHVDFARQSIGVQGKTEKDAVRWLVMSPKLEEVLQRWPTTHAEDERIFPFSKRTFWKMVKEVLHDARVARLEPYALRKTFVSYFSEVAGLDAAQEAARHSSPDTTMRFYNQIRQERQRQGHADLLAYFEGGSERQSTAQAAEEKIRELLAKHPELQEKFVRADAQ